MSAAPPLKELLGHSVQERPLELLQLTQGKVNLLLIGGVHGDEPEGFYLVERYVREGEWRELEGLASLYVLPRANPDGCALCTRANAHGVDLNRNMATKDWSPKATKPHYTPGPAANSEPETKIIEALVQRLKPRAILSAHSWEPMINYNGPCQKWAEHMARFNHYKITADIGYPTPGSLGTWAGWERSIPTITLEIERHASEEKIWATHARALTEALLYAAQNEKLG